MKSKRQKVLIDINQVLKFHSTPASTNEKKLSSWVIIVLFGMNSLVADIIYEGNRSIAPNFLQSLGMTAFQVGLVVGVAEFVGYLTRFVAGKAADRYKIYWFLLVCGYLEPFQFP